MSPREQYMNQMMNQGLRGQLGAQFIGAGQSPLQQAALMQQYATNNQAPIPPPEPNKVLLLLGDDE